MTLITTATSSAYRKLEVVPEPTPSPIADPQPGLVLAISEQAVSAPIALPALRSVEVLAEPGEFAELRCLLAERLPEQVGQRIELTVSGETRTGGEVERSGRDGCRADLVVLLLDDSEVASLQESPAGGVKAEFQRAVARPTTSVLVFSQEERSDPGERGLCDDPLANLDLVVRIVDAELERLDELQVAATAGLGDRLRSSASWRWRNDALSGLDRRMLGTPKRRARSEAGSGADRAANEWEQVCKAYEVESVDFMRQHLARVLEITPLDGEARLWQARLDLLDAESDESLRAVADDALTAAEIFERGGGVGAGRGEVKRDVRAGYASLLCSKALRRVSSDPNLRTLHEDAYRASIRAVEQVGWHAESHLELAYTALLTGRRSEAAGELVKAFYRLPLSLGEAKAELATIPGGTELGETVSASLASEAATDLRKMMRFGAMVDESAAGVEAENRAVAGQATAGSLGLAERLDQRPTGGFADELDTPIIPGLSARGELGRNGHSAAGERFDAFTDLVGEDPVRLAGAAQAMAVENLERVRALSAAVGEVADRAERANTEKEQAATEGIQAGPIVRGVLIATVVASVVLGIWMRSGTWFSRTLTFGLFVAIVATIAVVVVNQSRARATNDESLRWVGRLSDLVHRFESVTTQYEKLHLHQQLYVPRRRWERATGARETYRLERGVHPAESDDPVAPRIRALLESEPDGWTESGLAPYGLYSSATGRTGRAKAEDAIRWLSYAPSILARVERDETV